MTSALAVANLITVPAFSKSSLDGFYVGASAGHSSLDAKEKIGIYTNEGSILSPNSSPNAKSNNFIGSVHTGYGMTFNEKFYLGTELFLGYDNHSTKYNQGYSDGDDQGKVQDSLSRKYAVGLNFTPGVYLKEDTLALLKVGINASRFEYKIQDNFYAGDDEVTHHLSGKKSQTLTGLNLGFALKMSMTEKLSLRLDVDHTTYRSFRHSKSRSDNNHKVTTKIKPTTTAITAGFSYKI